MIDNTTTIISDFDKLHKQHTIRLKQRKRGLHNYTKIGLAYQILKKLACTEIKGTLAKVQQVYFKKSELIGYSLRSQDKPRASNILELLNDKNLVKKLTRKQLIEENPRHLFNETKCFKHKKVEYYYRITDKGNEYYNILKDIIEKDFEIKDQEGQEEEE